jgi:type I restriction enzyme S subunit
MSSEWPHVALEDLTDGTTITYGVVKPGDESEDGVLFIRGGDVVAGQIQHTQLRTISREVSDQYSRTLLRGGELLISLVGNPGEVALVPTTLKGANIARQVGLVRIDSSKADPNYIQFFFRSKIGRDVLLAHSKGSVQQVINLKDLKALKIPLPELSAQRSIAASMQVLDDRITLLRETNATLEAIAQAIFKSWFVDFDPVRAKQEGRAPEGMDEATVALFPDSFEESALGLVPRGWGVGSIYEVAQVTYGAPFASSRFNSEKVGRPLIRIRDLKDESPGVFTEEVHPKGRLVLPGEIVVGMDGEFRAYLWGGEPAWLNQRLCLFSPVGDAPTAFVRHSIIPLLAAVEASETATTVIHLGKNDIDRFKVRIPTSPVLKAFGEVTNPIYKKFVASKLEASTLSTLRDTLLPRLISGQLRLPDAEDIIAETVT